MDSEGAGGPPDRKISCLKVTADSADTEGMKTGLEDLTIVHLTQQWVLLNDAWYREAYVRDSSGSLRYVAILDELL